ncbi:4Fe-4S binding protein [Oceanirhabdus seepicola]|uniref:4Fe-4S binding protein n=1 Tax=Oceanirhabdus seepicola TaxID=2828781 RepID=A0A9J6P678_9CLOT|nr:4Fe-4S binding protein [Oceanirhabdus seepicola]
MNNRGNLYCSWICPFGAAQEAILILQNSGILEY